MQVNEEKYRRLLEDDSPHIGIKDMHVDSRPREKLLKEGKERLSEAELLAILIGSGSREKSAVELMEDILRDCGDSLALLDRMTLEELQGYKGIGEAKAITIVAASELNNRRLEEKLNDKLQDFSRTDTVYNFMKGKVATLSYEESWALFLNNNAHLLRATKLSQGGMTGTVVDVRILLKRAILADATNVILVHNHPSGSLRPSRDDDNLTMSVKNALAMVDIRLLDHVIVTDGGYYSYNEMGRM